MTDQTPAAIAYDAAVAAYRTACAERGVEPDPNEEATVGALATDPGPGPGWGESPPMVLITITISLASFDLAVAVWAAAAAAPRAGVYPAAVADLARAAAPKGWGPLALPSWEHMLAAGEAAAAKVDDGQWMCQRPDPLTLCYGHGASRVRIDRSDDARWLVVIDGPAESSLDERLGGAVAMLHDLRVIIGHGAHAAQISRDGGDIADSTRPADMVGTLAAERIAAQARIDAAKATEAEVVALRREVSADGAWDDPARMAEVHAAEAAARAAYR